MKKLLLFAMLLSRLVFPANAFAQTPNATLGGTVADATGAFIPGVTVSASNVGTGIVNETITNETGTYQFSNLQPERMNTDHNLYARDPNNRNQDKALLGFHRTHIITGNGTYTLPFGSERRLLSGAPAWVQQLVAQWQLGGLMRWNSGSPLTITAGGLNTIGQDTGGNTADILGVLPKGNVVKLTGGKVPTFFDGLTQGTDPDGNIVTATNRLNASYNRLAIFDAQGNPLLVNP